jgi:translocation and assembly module TamA
MSRYLLSALLLLLTPTAAWASPPELRIEITGISGDMLANVQAGLSLYLQRDHPLLSEALIRRHHQNAPEQIRKALEPFGYYRPQIESILEHDGNRWIARYMIAPGAPVRISEVRLEIDGPGASDPGFQHWQANYPLSRGDVLSHRSYEDAKGRLLQMARERGYAEGRLVRHRVTVNLETMQADIDMRYATGPRYTFGEITIDQEDFDEGFLRRYLTFQTGDPYDAAQLLALRRALADSDYFERADVMPMHDLAEDGRIPVHIVLRPRKRKLYTAGLGYSTDTGARGRLGFEERRANQYGHRYDTTLRVSEIQSGVSARYHVPLARPITDTLTYSAIWLDEETDATDRTTASIGADVTMQAGRWLRSTGLTYEWERFTIADEEERSLLLIPNVRWQRVSADQRILTRRGWIYSIGFRGASAAILSNTSFLQARSSGKYIRGVTERTRVLLRAAGGASWTPEFTELPTSQRFFAGGDQSVRGYSYNSLGPEDDVGRVIGGRHLLVGSIEYEFAFLPRTSVAAFYDAGNAFNSDDYDPQAGAGVGLRWKTPIGAIRLDVAQALSKDSRPWRLHLTLGPDL